MEKELKGHVDILSFNFDKVLKEMKSQSKLLVKMDVDIGNELGRMKKGF